MVPLTGPRLAVRTMMCWTSRQERLGLKLNEQNDTKLNFNPSLAFKNILQNLVALVFFLLFCFQLFI